MSYHIKVPKLGLALLGDDGNWHTDIPALAAALADHEDKWWGPPGDEPDKAWWEASRMARLLAGTVVENRARPPTGPTPPDVVY